MKSVSKGIKLNKCLGKNFSSSKDIIDRSKTTVKSKPLFPAEDQSIRRDKHGWARYMKETVGCELQSQRDVTEGAGERGGRITSQGVIRQRVTAGPVNPFILEDKRVDWNACFTVKRVNLALKGALMMMA